MEKPPGKDRKCIGKEKRLIIEKRNCTPGVQKESEAMATITAAVMLIGGLIAIILMIVTIIYPEWFSNSSKSVVRAIITDRKKDKNKSDQQLI